MVEPQDDEETPLLQHPQQVLTTPPKTPLPWDQFWVVLLLHVANPLGIQTLAPFIPQSIRDIGVTHGDESLVGYYVAILYLSYSAAQAVTVFSWSQLSDHTGRKPVLLIALSGISASMLSFGFSKTFFSLVVSRIICGAFNPSNGMIKSVVMDITDATNLPRAYNYMPVSFMLGHMLGPIIGGTFSRPVDRFPRIFGRSEFLRTYPYLLPCAVPAAFSAVAWLLAFFCLKESAPIKVPHRGWINERFLQWSPAKSPSSGELSNASEEVNSADVTSRPLPLRALLTRKVIIVAASYATMALVYVTFMSIIPVFYSTPIDLGGLSLDPPVIGAILATSGLAHGLFQFLFFARLHDHFGAGALYTTGVLSGIPMVILFPVINSLARAHGMGLAVWLAIGVQHALVLNLVMCYSCLALFIKAAVPNRASLGATNGITQVVVMAGKIVGPVSVALAFSYSIREGHNAWLVYYFFMTLVFLAVGISMLLPRDPSQWESPSE